MQTNITATSLRYLCKKPLLRLLTADKTVKDRMVTSPHTRPPHYTASSILAAVEEGVLERLQWQHHHVLGDMICVHMPNASSDLILVRNPSHKTPRYDVFTAGSLPEFDQQPRDSQTLIRTTSLVETYFDALFLSDQTKRDVALRAKDVKKLINDIVRTDETFPLPRENAPWNLRCKRPTIGRNWIEAVTQPHPSAASRPARGR